MNDQKRVNAIQLLGGLDRRSDNSSAGITNARIMDIATQIGLDDQELVSALNYGVQQGWLDNNEKVGSVFITEAGEAAAGSSRSSQ